MEGRGLVRRQITADPRFYHKFAGWTVQIHTDFCLSRWYSLRQVSFALQHDSQANHRSIHLVVDCEKFLHDAAGSRRQISPLDTLTDFVTADLYGFLFISGLMKQVYRCHLHLHSDVAFHGLFNRRGAFLETFNDRRNRRPWRLWFGGLGNGWLRFGSNTAYSVRLDLCEATRLFESLLRNIACL